MSNKIIIFGSAGFVGRNLINILGSNYLGVDIDTTNGQTKYLDICHPIEMEEDDISVIYNLAAVHKTPGHKLHEYFETNIKGAENVCEFARKKNVNTIVFTSSIAPYGNWEDEKTEDSLPFPTSAYGTSKLVAEEIHKRWQAENPTERKLIIVRPGVVFGQYEGGNFTRLYRAMKNGRFFYPGRRDTKKAAIYVKDLVRLMVEMGGNENPGIHTYNLVYTPCYTLEEICKSMAMITGIRQPKLTIPASALKLAAFTIHFMGKVIGKSFDGIHPDRVKKIMISTNIVGQKLVDHGYELKYPLEEAIEDWFNDCDRIGLY